MKQNLRSLHNLTICLPYPIVPTVSLYPKGHKQYQQQTSGQEEVDEVPAHGGEPECDAVYSTHKLNMFSLQKYT